MPDGLALGCSLWSTAGPTFAAFLLGAAGTVLGTLVSWRLVGAFLDPRDGFKARTTVHP